MLQHLNQQRNETFLWQSLLKHVRRQLTAQLFTIQLEIQSLESESLNIISWKKNIPRKRHHHYGMTLKIERLFILKAKPEIELWFETRDERVKASTAEKQEKKFILLEASNSTPLNVYYCFRLVNEKSLFEGAQMPKAKDT